MLAPFCDEHPKEEEKGDDANGRDVIRYTRFLGATNGIPAKQEKSKSEAN